MNSNFTCLVPASHAIRNMMLMKKYLVCVLLLVACYTNIEAQTLPTNWSSQQVLPVSTRDFDAGVGLTFTPDGQKMFIWTISGIVYICTWDGSAYVRQTTPVLDISQEVAGYRDHGLLGFALDPNFNSNGFIYLLYVVDRHHLEFFGTSQYNPGTNTEYAATIGRITRYKIPSGSNVADVNSRFILLGETKGTGVPVTEESHSVGTLLFGSDGTLLASVGDGASYDCTDIGTSNSCGLNFTWAANALSFGIITAQENVGAYRSQLLNSHSGKILRIDPATGDGIPSNPFYDPNNPRAPKSRVWAMGLRNPFRMNIKPNTGSLLPSSGDPGTLYISDVQWGTWEEISVCDKPGQNFGWPIFEGIFRVGNDGVNSYANRSVNNLQEPNPLFGQGGCTQQYFYFRNLIKDPTPDNNLVISNPCNSNQAIDPGGNPNRFVHARPLLEWRHGQNQTRVPVFINNLPDAVMIDINGANQAGVTGEPFAGAAAVGGAFYSGNRYPPDYNNSYFLADYNNSILKNLNFELDNKLSAVRNFGSSLTAISMMQNPLDGYMYYMSFNDPSNGISRVRRFVYGGNMLPIPKIVINNNQGKNYGPSTLQLELRSDGTADPDGSIISYEWNFGDGSPISTAQNPPIHSFTGSPGVPAAYTVKLTVRDNSNAIAETTMLVTVNNTPPTVQITNPVHNSDYPVNQMTNYQLTANVQDAEQPGNLSYEWQVLLGHNSHVHPEAPLSNVSPNVVVSGQGCNGETYYYSISLTVTDPLGLKGEAISMINPDCAALPVNLVSFSGAKENNTNRLKWKTASETFIIRYDIQRSADGRNFEKIGEHNVKDGHGIKEYIYYDQLPLPGNNFYRLRMVHPDGTDEYSMIIKLSQTNSGNQDFRVYPVPFKNHLVIQNNFPRQTVAIIQLVDVQGRKVFTRTESVLPGTNIIAISNLTELQGGIYFVNILFDGEVRRSKVIKMKN